MRPSRDISRFVVANAHEAWNSAARRNSSPQPLGASLSGFVFYLLLHLLGTAGGALPAASPTNATDAAGLWDGWHRWAVLVSSPGLGFGEVPVTPDSVRAGVLSYDPDYIDWGAGAALNRAGYCRNRGIPHAQPQQFEYDWSFAFTEDDPMHRYFLINGVARNETGGTILTTSSEVNGGDANRMCHNAPLWQLVQGQGLARLAAYSDAVSCDDAGNGVATGQDYNWCDWCNRAFLNSSAAGSLLLPADFNIRDYLKTARGAAARNLSAMELIQDPVLHAYSLSQYSAQAEAWGSTRQTIQRAAAQLGRKLKPLVYGNSWGLWVRTHRTSRPCNTLVAAADSHAQGQVCWQDLGYPVHEMGTSSLRLTETACCVFSIGCRVNRLHRR